MQLFTIIGTSFLLSCWSCNALPSVPAAFSIAVYQTMKSSLVWPWIYRVLKSIKIFWAQERNKKMMLSYHGNKADVQKRKGKKKEKKINTWSKTSRHLSPHKAVMVVYCYSIYFFFQIHLYYQCHKKWKKIHKHCHKPLKEPANILITLLRCCSYTMHSYVQATAKQETNLETTFNTVKSFPSFVFMPLNTTPASSIE